MSDQTESIHIPTDTAHDDSPDRGTVELSESAKKYEESIRQALLAELDAKKGAGSDGTPRARRGKKDELRASDYEQPMVEEQRPAALEPDPDPEPVAPIQGQDDGAERTGFAQVTNRLEQLRRDRETEKAASKKAFEEAERALLAERDAIQRDLIRRDQEQAARMVRSHVQAVRNQAQAELPTDPADRRSPEHRKFLAQCGPLMDGVRETQQQLAEFSRNTLPSLRAIAGLTMEDFPASWPTQFQQRALGLTAGAAKVADLVRVLTEQAQRAVANAERMVAMEFLDLEEPDVRTRCRIVLQELGYIQPTATADLRLKADNLIGTFTRIRTDAAEFERKTASEPIVIVLDPGRAALRKGQHRAFKPEPKPQPDVLSSLGIDASKPPRI